MEAKQMLHVARAETNQGYKDSVVDRCAFCKQKVWISKAARAYNIDTTYVLGCDKCFPARVVRGPKTP